MMLYHNPKKRVYRSARRPEIPAGTKYHIYKELQEEDKQKSPWSHIYTLMKESMGANRSNFIKEILQSHKKHNRYLQRV